MELPSIQGKKQTSKPEVEREKLLAGQNQVAPSSQSTPTPSQDHGPSEAEENEDTASGKESGRRAD